MGKSGILLVNLGTPAQLSRFAVARYLRQFLTDPRVIDIPALGRWLLVHLIIVPFRSGRSLNAYKKIWLKEGSPLKVYSQHLIQALSADLDRERYAVALAMRYQSPSIQSALSELTRRGCREVLVLPMFPQYAAATVGSLRAELYQQASKIWDPPIIRHLSPESLDLKFHQLWAEHISEHLSLAKEDSFFVFSFHGLPERQIHKSCQGCHFEDRCCSLPSQQQRCYRAQCWLTAKKIAESLQLPEHQWRLSFQSQLGRGEWLKPSTLQVIANASQNNIKNMVMVSPSFVSDCLETIEELGVEARQKFLQGGGAHFELIPSLNSSPAWVQYLKERIEKVWDESEQNA